MTVVFQHFCSADRTSSVQSIIGDGTTGRLGSIVSQPPIARPNQEVWEQQVGTATTASLIGAPPGIFFRVPALGRAPIAIPGVEFVVATVFSRTVLGLLGRKAIADADYVVSDPYSSVGMTALTAARMITLPAAAVYPPGQSFVVADESGLYSGTSPLTIAAAVGDTIAGQPSVSLAASYACLTLRSNGDHLWIVP